MQSDNLFKPGQEHSLYVQSFAGNIELKTCGAQSKLVLICCHPHPLHGGSMQNKVITTAASAAHRVGINTVGFNFRGVGNSEGTWDNGIGEKDDLRAVIDFVKQQQYQDICLFGFSFGSMIASCVSHEYDIKNLILAAPVVERAVYPLHFSVPVHILQPLEDEVVSVAAVKSWYKDIESAKSWHEFAGASHFFHGNLITLRSVCECILQDYV